MIYRLSMLLCIAAAGFAATPGFGQENEASAPSLRPGFIQVKCPPGVTVYLDGEKAGVTTEDLGGLVIEDVAVGPHVVTCVKKGFRPQETRLTVTAGGVHLVRVNPFVERAPVKEDGREAESAIGQNNGTLVIRTVPVDCHLRIPELEVDSEKSSTEWRAETVPEGTYHIEVTCLGRTLKQAVAIVAGGTAEVLFNVIRGNVEVFADEKAGGSPGGGLSLPERIEALAENVVQVKKQLDKARQQLKNAGVKTTLRQIRAMVDRRDQLERQYNDMSYELKVIKQRWDLEKERALREELVARRKRFTEEYATYRQLRADQDLSSAVKFHAWQQLCKRWEIDPGKEPGKLLWDERGGRPYKVISQMLPLGGGQEMEMVRIKGGTFQMGDEDGDTDERPAHSVTISRPFWMGKYEVTQAQYEAVMGTNPAHFDGADRPVEMVSWEEADEFCRKLTDRERELDRLVDGYEYRLPTEAEWEYACRAGTDTAFSFGERLEATDANADHNYGRRLGRAASAYRETLPVGSFKANTWDLYDMHGNVWEWCLDWYDREFYARSPQIDPVNRRPSAFKVCRGGSWVQPASFSRSANRNYGGPRKANHMTGFRVVLAPIPGATLP